MRVIKIPKKSIEDLILDDFGGEREEKTVCIVRYGAWGDMIIASSLFPWFKERGYKVCVNVSDRGFDIVKSDPNVDEIMVQQTDQIPNTRLSEYWELMSKCFDKFVQLSESIEQTLLLMPRHSVMIDGKKAFIEANPNYYKDKAFIHNLCNVNYLERTHDLAGVPYEDESGSLFKPKFFPSNSEKKFAKDFKRRVKSKNLVMWVLSGSSVHKVYPWTDSVIAKFISERDDISFVTVGDEACQMLEIGWEKERRVITKSGKLSIRNTLALLDVCNVVVGPETGVLNAASFTDAHKSIFLSHSSEENMTKHWTNTTAFEPDDCPCFPCHKMHFGFDTCNRDLRTGGALCAANILPEKVYNDIERHLR